MSKSNHRSESILDISSILDVLKSETIIEKQFPLFLVGEIAEPSFAALMVQISRAEHSFAERGKSFKNVVLRLTSPGGHIGLGFALYDAIKASPLSFTAETYGCCCSAAILPLMAADVRVTTKHCQFLLHEAFVSTEEPTKMDKNDLMANHKELDVLINNYCKVIAKRCGVPIAVIKKLCKEEKTLTAQEALDLNLVDKIL